MFRHFQVNRSFTVTNEQMYKAFAKTKPSLAHLSRSKQIFTEYAGPDEGPSLSETVELNQPLSSPDCTLENYPSRPIPVSFFEYFLYISSRVFSFKDAGYYLVGGEA